MSVVAFGGRNLKKFQNSFKVSKNHSFGLLSLNPYVKSPKKYLDNPRSRFESLGFKSFKSFFFTFVSCVFGVLFWFCTDFLTSFFLVFLIGIFFCSLSMVLFVVLGGIL